MSWSDAIKDAVGNLVGEAEQSALPDLVKKVLGNEGLQSILAKLQDAGLQAQVSSWIDKNKTNLPITPEQIRTALGDEHVQQVAKSLGIPMDKVRRRSGEISPCRSERGGTGRRATACRRSINRDNTRFAPTLPTTHRSEPPALLGHRVVANLLSLLFCLGSVLSHRAARRHPPPDTPAYLVRCSKLYSACLS